MRCKQGFSLETLLAVQFSSAGSVHIRYTYERIQIESPQNKKNGAVGRLFLKKTGNNRNFHRKARTGSHPAFTVTDSLNGNAKDSETLLP